MSPTRNRMKARVAKINDFPLTLQTEQRHAQKLKKAGKRSRNKKKKAGPREG